MPYVGVELLAVYSVAFAPDGATIASGGSDRKVTLWSAAGEKRWEREVRPRGVGRASGTRSTSAMSDRGDYSRARKREREAAAAEVAEVAEVSTSELHFHPPGMIGRPLLSGSK